MTTSLPSVLGRATDFAGKPSHTSFCVLIPAFNEELLLGRCIASVRRAGVGPSHIYVVDDASTDGTADVVRAISGVNLLSDGCKRGKLGGIREAMSRFELAGRYDYLAILDADSHVAPDYFDEVLVRFLQDSDTVLVSGAPQSERYNWLTAYRAYEYAVTLRLYRRGQHAMNVVTVAPGCASVYRTRILPFLQWDSHTLVEDMDLTVQVHRGRLGRVAYTPHAIAFTQDPRTLRDYIGQLTRWYRGTWQVMRLRNVPFGRQRIDAEFALLLGEGLFFATMTLLLPVLAWLWPSIVLRLLVIDQAIVLTLAIACAWAFQRLDILACVPAFPFLRVINSVILLKTFWLEVIRRQHALDWFTVARYDAGVPPRR
jgi:cellulose synthase/poly-beta-1,6-N-acetylglucosamine synthase-like glycosyltransferase